MFVSKYAICLILSHELGHWVERFEFGHSNFEYLICARHEQGREEKKYHL
jgi:hypothetical protein